MARSKAGQAQPRTATTKTVWGASRSIGTSVFNEAPIFYTSVRGHLILALDDINLYRSFQKPDSLTKSEVAKGKG